VYTIIANPGSAPLLRVQAARGLNPTVAAQVTTRGGASVLHYAIAGAGGQRVVFAERDQQGLRIIGSTTSAHGTLLFRPARGSGTGTIVAEIMRDGAPIVLSVSPMTNAGTRTPGPSFRFST
jgi:hypothetical protein